MKEPLFKIEDESKLSWALRCYTKHSMREMQKMLNDGPEELDLTFTGLTETDWLEAVAAALDESVDFEGRENAKNGK